MSFYLSLWPPIKSIWFTRGTDDIGVEVRVGYGKRKTGKQNQLAVDRQTTSTYPQKYDSSVCLIWLWSPFLFLKTIFFLPSPALLRFSRRIELDVSSTLVLARHIKSCVQVSHTYNEKERLRCLNILVLVLPRLDTGRYVWICLPQAGRDKPGKAFWKSSEACCTLCCSTGVLLDSDLCWSSGVLFEFYYFFIIESLTALATRDLGCSKSLIELSINFCSFLQRPPSKAIFSKTSQIS